MTQTDQKFVVSKAESWQMFNKISPKYDCVNHLMTFGMDWGWRKKLVRFLPEAHSLKVLDLACGTADVTIELFKSSDRVERAVGLDLAEDMLAIGRKKIAKEKLNDKIVLQGGDAQNLLFEAESFDAVTIAFGIRNMPDMNKVLIEIKRVLKPKGRLLILEASMPTNPVIRAGHLFYIKHIIPFFGGIISGDKKAYRYLNQTVEDFPSGEAFKSILVNHGFQNVQDLPLLFGASSIYIGEK